MEFSKEGAVEDGELVRKTLNLISNKWHPQILHFLLIREESSFKQLKDGIEGISNKVLSGSLKDLESKNLVRKEKEESKSSYELTEKGKSLKPVIDQALRWGRANIAGIREFSILIVEDEKKQADMYERWLGDIYHIEKASRGSEAIEKFTVDTDILLLDRRLPDINANQLMNMLRSSVEDKYIIMTSAIDPGVEIASMDINEYLTKPISREQLRESIERAKEIENLGEEQKKIVKLMKKKEILESKKSLDNKTLQKKYTELEKKIENKKKNIEELPDSLKEKIIN